MVSPRLTAAVCRPEDSISNYCIKSERICSLSMTFISVVDHNPSGYISKCIISVSKIVLFSSNITQTCFAFPGQSLALFTMTFNLQSGSVSLRTQNILDRSPKVAAPPFNNKGEDHIALIYCLIKIQPLPSP